MATQLGLIPANDNSYSNSDSNIQWCPFARVPMMVQLGNSSPLNPGSSKIAIVSANRDAGGSIPAGTECIREKCGYSSNCLEFKRN